MGWNRNNRCTYNYEVKIDISDLIDRITDNLPGDMDEYDFDGDVLTIGMSDSALADVWYCRQTLYDPEEYEVELKKSVEDVNVEKEIIKAMQSIDNMDVELEIDYDSIDIEPSEPDPDRAYDEWRDRQFEEERRHETE